MDDALIQPYFGHESRKSLEVYSSSPLPKHKRVQRGYPQISNLTHTLALGDSDAGIIPIRE
ncbi:hypothetical protein [Paenibacillus polymyxa]|uniref:hypothetical protein n=1 Tax=Paenibacillus polymyxa TaxID=1406 RepID=UPI00201D5E5A|nr:hypothetical protein [Paenibacillus polymyxa]